MRRFIVIMLALLLCVSLAACGGDSKSSGTPAASIPEGADITEDQLKRLTEAYNAVAPTYNEAQQNAEENGWMDDEQTAAEINAMSASLGTVAQALTEDLTVLNGADIEKLISTIESLAEPMQGLADRVSEPYGG